MKQKKSTSIFLFLICLLFIGLIFLNLTSFIDSGRAGFALFSSNVLPVLFPFFFITSLMIESGMFDTTPRFLSKIMKSVFNVDGKVAGIFGLSILSGYPTSARMLAELYDKGEISRSDAIRASTFTSITSPIFVIATVGAALYGNMRMGIVIFIAMVIGAILNGIIYRKVSFKNEKVQNSTPHKVEDKSEHISRRSTSDAIMSSLQSSIQSILMVGGLIVIFFIIAGQIDTLFNLSMRYDIILSSLLEMTRGIFLLSTITDTTILFHIVIGTIILTIGGFCIAMQGFLFFKRFSMPLWFYLLYKTTHTLLSACVALIIILFI